MRSENGVLYIHPRHTGYGRTGQIPMGVIGLLNDLAVPKRGVFAQHLTAADLEGVGAVVMDIHWYMALASGLATARRVKALRPEVAVLVGGYTATVYADELLGEPAIDAVLAGDAEGCFREIATALAAREPIASLPNLRWRGGRSPATYVTTVPDYDRLDYYTIDWFPRLRRLALHFQRRNAYPTFLYPFVPVFKGCRSDCVNCYGTPTNQRTIAGRGRITRSADAVRSDLRRLSGDPEIHLAYMAVDFAAYESADYTRAILEGPPFDLDLYYEFTHVPEAGTIDLFRRAFRRLHVAVSTLANHAEPREAPGLERLPEVVKTVLGSGGTATLFVNPRLVREPDYPRRVLRAWIAVPRTEILDSSIMNIPVPTPGQGPDARRREFERFLGVSRRPRNPAFFLRERLVRLLFLGSTATRVLRRLHTFQNVLSLAAHRLARAR
jgi:hypothetical protein